jgi:hypothetical protein
VNNDDILVAGAARRSCGRGEDHEQTAKRKCHLLLLLDEFRACFGDFLSGLLTVTAPMRLLDVRQTHSCLELLNRRFIAIQGMDDPGSLRAAHAQPHSHSVERST